MVLALTLHRPGERRSWASRWRWHPPSRPRPLRWERGLSPGRQAPRSRSQRPGGEASPSPRASRKGSCARDVALQTGGPSFRNWSKTSSPGNCSKAAAEGVRWGGQAPGCVASGVGASRASLSGTVSMILRFRTVSNAVVTRSSQASGRPRAHTPHGGPACRSCLPPGEAVCGMQGGLLACLTTCPQPLPAPERSARLCESPQSRRQLRGGLLSWEMWSQYPQDPLVVETGP